MSKRTFGGSILVLAVLAVLTALPASAGEASSHGSLPAVGTAPAAAPAGCGLDLALLAQPTLKGETCPATAPAAPETAAPTFLTGLRTCRCSCGLPCKTDADCFGAICTSGISCC